jgi:hypothetical protein
MSADMGAKVEYTTLYDVLRMVNKTNLKATSGFGLPSVIVQSGLKLSPDRMKHAVVQYCKGIHNFVTN